MKNFKIWLSVAVMLIGFVICVVEIDTSFWGLLTKTAIGYLLFYLGLKRLENGLSELDKDA